MKNINKTTKTILFASLLIAMILPFSGMEFAEAKKVDKNELEAKLKDVDISKHKKKLLEIIPSEECKNNILKNKDKSDKKIDIQKNIKESKEHKEFTKNTKDRQPKYISTLTEYDVDTQNCDVMLIAIHTIFESVDDEGENKELLYVTKKFVDGKKVKTEFKVDKNLKSYTKTFAQSSNYVGYGTHTGSTNTVPVYGSLGVFQQPTVSVSTSNPESCNPICNIAVWTGIANNNDPNVSPTAIAQSGTDAEIQCSPNCTSVDYGAWVQFYPNPALQCQSMVISPNDYIEADTFDRRVIGGTPDTYNSYVYNYTTQQMCGVFSSTFPQMGIPYEAYHIAERVSYNGGTIMSGIPEFTPIVFVNSGLYYENSWKGLYTPFSDEHYQKWWINATGQTGGWNTAAGSINSSDQFYILWNTSEGT